MQRKPVLQSDPGLPAPARLLIHAEGPGSADGGAFEAALARLWTILTAGAWHGQRAPLRLLIEDLQGHSVLAVDDVGTLFEVPLPAGTYRVNADAGKVRRSYTMTLAPGASFDLHLRLWGHAQRR